MEETRKYRGPGWKKRSYSNSGMEEMRVMFPGTVPALCFPVFDPKYAADKGLCFLVRSK
jgi:hypothetical protein